MPSERVQRQIDRFLDAAEDAVSQKNWALARENAVAVLDLDPENEDAQSFLAAANRAVARAEGEESRVDDPGAAGGKRPTPAQPTSFCEGRYLVKRFVGEGGKKRVYLAHDAKLDRDVAFALIKTDGLDDEGLLRIRREAQAMGRLGDHPHIAAVYDIGASAHYAQALDVCGKLRFRPEIVLTRLALAELAAGPHPNPSPNLEGGARR